VGFKVEEENKHQGEEIKKYFIIRKIRASVGSVVGPK